MRRSNRAYARVLAAVRAVQAKPSVHGLLARSWTSVQLMLADAVNAFSIATRKSARHCLRPHCSESATHRRRMYRRVRGLGAFSAIQARWSCRPDLRTAVPHAVSLTLIDRRADREHSSHFRCRRRRPELHRCPLLRSAVHRTPSHCARHRAAVRVSSTTRHIVVDARARLAVPDMRGLAGSLHVTRSVSPPVSASAGTGTRDVCETSRSGDTKRRHDQRARR